jgi:hypothetical protein
VIALARRASAILFSLLRARADPRPYLLPANVCSIVPETFRAAAQPFELVDLAEPWLEVDAEQCLEQMHTRAYAGLLFVRPYGSERDPSAFFAAARAADPELLIIDDKCLCPPDCDGASLSRAADVTLFSTGYGKFADIGGGGFAHLREGLSYRPASSGPDWLDLEPFDLSWAEYRERVFEAARDASAHKRALNEIYARGIPEDVQLPGIFQQWRFHIRVDDAAGLVAALFAEGLFASRHYPPLGEYPVAARLHSRIVNLFNDRSFRPEQARRAAEIVARHLSTRERAAAMQERLPSNP